MRVLTRGKSVRAYIVSDVHLEFEAFEIRRHDAELIILAGDIGLGLRGLEWAANTFKGKPIIYVPGNHEYYGQAIPRLTAQLKECGQAMGVHVLDCDTVDIDGCTVLGTTLWTDFSLFGNPSSGEYCAQQNMNDYRRIRVSPTFRRLRARDTSSMHFKMRRWLEHEIEKGSTRDSVIVTHHAPSKRSLDPKLGTDEVSVAFASELDDLVKKTDARLWIHGHTHHSVDYMIGNTRVLSNQRGYPGEADASFRTDFCIDI